MAYKHFNFVQRLLEKELQEFLNEACEDPQYFIERAHIIYLYHILDNQRKDGPLLPTEHSLDAEEENEARDRIQSMIQLFKGDELTALTVSSIFALLLQIEDEQDDLRALELVCSAFETLGVARITLQQHQAGIPLAIAVHKNILSKKGGQAKSDSYQPAREEVVRLATLKPYKNNRQAALAIMPDIVDFCEKHDIPLTDDTYNALTTITRWMREAGLQLRKNKIVPAES